jgi:hypothetical protein
METRAQRQGQVKERGAELGTGQAEKTKKDKFRESKYSLAFIRCCK